MSQSKTFSEVVNTFMTKANTFDEHMHTSETGHAYITEVVQAYKQELFEVCTCNMLEDFTEGPGVYFLTEGNKYSPLTLEEFSDIIAIVCESIWELTPKMEKEFSSSIMTLIAYRK